MSIKLICYGVRDVEIPFFKRLNKYSYELVLEEDFLNHDNVELAKDAQAVMIRGNCNADSQNIEKLNSYGVKYILTRTVGFNHIDLEAANKFGIKVARVPGYSPNAISELAVTLAMMFLRHTAYTVDRTKNKNFVVDENMFSKEIRKCTVGVLGTGKIGYTTAKLFNGLGANVLAYDIVESEEAKKIVKYMSLDDVLKYSDIISVHVPFIRYQNYKMINQDFISKMKDGAILINTARGELQDNDAILKAIENNKLGGFGCDVFENETDFFFKDLTNQSLKDNTLERLVNYYPKVLITPHIGSYTDEALINMIEISYDNLNDFLTKQESINEVK